MEIFDLLKGNFMEKNVVQRQEEFYGKGYDVEVGGVEFRERFRGLCRRVVFFFGFLFVLDFLGKNKLGVRWLFGFFTIFLQDSYMLLWKVWKEKWLFLVFQLYCIIFWDDVLVLFLFKGSGRLRYLVVRFFSYRGLGIFCVFINQQLLSRDVVERLSDSMLRMVDRNVRWLEKFFGSFICNR